VTIALYPGSFDPITYGHLDIAIRASKLFEKLVIGIFNNPSEKVVLFSTEERVKLAKSAVSDYPNIEVRSYTELTGEFARKIGAGVMVRGLRMGGDFEREFTLTMMGRKLFPDVEQICFMASVEFQFLSSSILKEGASLGAKIEEFVPPEIALALKRKYGRNNNH
jgi:pantetheine-phosphate adenylyltransferase